MCRFCWGRGAILRIGVLEGVLGGVCDDGRRMRLVRVLGLCSQAQARYVSSWSCM